MNEFKLTPEQEAVKTAFTPRPDLQDDTALVQGYIDRGEEIPIGVYVIRRTLIARSTAGEAPP